MVTNLINIEEVSKYVHNELAKYDLPLKDAVNIPEIFEFDKITAKDILEINPEAKATNEELLDFTVYLSNLSTAIPIVATNKIIIIKGDNTVSKILDELILAIALMQFDKEISDELIKLQSVLETSDKLCLKHTKAYFAALVAVGNDPNVKELLKTFQFNYIVETLFYQANGMYSLHYPQNPIAYGNSFERPSSSRTITSVYGLPFYNRVVGVKPLFGRGNSSRTPNGDFTI